MKTVLITGATSGLGEALTYLLASKKYRLILTGRNFSRLVELQKALEHVVPVEIFSFDLAQPEERADLIRVLHEKKPDLFINNAGFGLYGEALTFETAEQLEILEVNGKAVLELTLEMARTLISSGKTGIILNVSSAASFFTFPSAAVYAASKSFVTQFSQALDHELKPQGVRVLVSCPGVIATNFQKRAGGDLPEREKEGTMTAAFVAEEIWKQIQNQTVLEVVNWRYKALLLISYCLPKKWIQSFLSGSIARRISQKNIIKVKE